MRRGEVWVANLNPNRGSEAGKIRPVLVVQDDMLTDADLPTVTVIPLTTQVRPGMSRLRVDVPSRDRLQHDSQVMIEQLRALDRKRLADGPLTHLSSTEMAAVEKAMRALLGLPLD